jgi:UDP-N-acetylmuramate dehydrogenase
MNSHPPCEYKLDFITAPLTTFKIGGPADIIAWPKNAQELIETIQWAQSTKTPITFLGGGSNVLISDYGIRGLLIVTANMNIINRENNNLLVECGAGCDVQKLVFWAADNNLSGLEFAGGLPGSLGGAIWMNARAYGSEFSGIVTWAETVNKNNEIEYFNNAQMEFLYKKSVFQNKKLFITRAKLQFKTGIKEEILSITQKNIDDRNSKKQDKIFSAGCVFKNNYTVGIPSGKLIQDAGLKGTTIGGARIFEEHANFVINANNAKAADVIALMKMSQKAVQEKFKVMIYPEVQFIGDYQNQLAGLEQD